MKNSSIGILAIMVGLIIISFQILEVQRSSRDLIKLQRAQVLYNFTYKGENTQPTYDYHINVHMDTAWLYDGNTDTLVGRCDFDSIPTFIMKDNQ